MNPTEARTARLCLALALLAFGWAVFASAWLCDDAWITLRSVDNLLGGHGLRWNPAERVQTFTHPLWALLLAALGAVFGDLYFTALGLSFACTAAAVALLVLRIARNAGEATLGLTALIASKASVDYSTSGLENPLSHLLLMLFLALWWKEPPGERRLLRLATTAALLATNRLDALLLVAPALAVAARAQGRAAWRPLALGAAPLVAWELFSLFYYGFPFPNTAYAKLATGIPASELVQQGGYYLVDAVLRDPATPLALVAGCGVALLRPRRTAPLALGIAIHLLYVVWIGGDFMSGRFLAAPLWCAAALLTRLPEALSLPRLRTAAAGGVALLLVSLLGAHPPLASTHEYGVGWPPDPGYHGIVDERAGYYARTGLWRVLSAGANPLAHPWAATAAVDRRRPDPVLLGGPVGLYGFYVGPEKYVLDEFALGDPLRARLPVPPGREWRIGHFPRPVPQGYVRTLASGRNQLADAALAALWDDLALVTRGPLFSVPRFAAMARLNFGGYALRSAAQPAQRPAP